MNTQNVNNNNSLTPAEAKKLLQDVLKNINLDQQTFLHLLGDTNADPQDVSSTTDNQTPKRGHGNIPRNIQDSNSTKASNRARINRLEQIQEINSGSDSELLSEKESLAEPEEYEGDEGSEEPDTPSESNQEVASAHLIGTPNNREDFIQILEKQDNSARDATGQYLYSDFVIDLMRDLFRLNKDMDAERFLCAKCLSNTISKKGRTKEKKHWYPFRSLLRHLLKAHVFEFKNNEKEFLKHIDFFKEVDKNDSNYDRIISKFSFTYPTLRKLSGVYYSFKEHNISKKNTILSKMKWKLKDLLGKNPDSNSRPVPNSSGSDRSLTRLEAKREIKRDRKRDKRVTRSEAVIEEQSHELKEEEKNEMQGDSFDNKISNKDLESSNKRMGADISGEDSSIKRQPTEGNMMYLQKFFELSCEKSTKEKEYQEDLARKDEEIKKLREELEKSKQKKHK